jgi:hypothetical protein
VSEPFESPRGRQTDRQTTRSTKEGPSQRTYRQPDAISKGRRRRDKCIYKFSADMGCRCHKWPRYECGAMDPFRLNDDDRQQIKAAVDFVYVPPPIVSQPFYSTIIQFMHLLVCCCCTYSLHVSVAAHVLPHALAAAADAWQLAAAGQVRCYHMHYGCSRKEKAFG